MFLVGVLIQGQFHCANSNSHLHPQQSLDSLTQLFHHIAWQLLDEFQFENTVRTPAVSLLASQLVAAVHAMSYNLHRASQGTEQQSGCWYRHIWLAWIIMMQLKSSLVFRWILILHFFSNYNHDLHTLTCNRLSLYTSSCSRKKET